MADKRRRKLQVIRRQAVEPMIVCDWETAELILAKLVARAWAADHPEIFEPHHLSATGGAVDEH